jgi:hypothetical protein
MMKMQSKARRQKRTVIVYPVKPMSCTVILKRGRGSSHETLKDRQRNVECIYPNSKVVDAAGAERGFDGG